MKARPSTEVKGTPLRAMVRKDWKPDGPGELGGVRVRTLSNWRYSMGAGRIPEFQSFKLLKSGEKRKLKVRCHFGASAWCRCTDEIAGPRRRFSRQAWFPSNARQVGP